jgi:N-acetylmuramoyl-L-alanine amidase
MVGLTHGPAGRKPVRWRWARAMAAGAGIVVLTPGAPFAQMPIPTEPATVNETPAVATDARVAGDDRQTRFVVDLSHKIDMRAFTLADPYRVVIDIPEVSFQLPPRTGERGRGVIKAFRYGLVMPGGSRIVIDLTGPARAAPRAAAGAP